MKRVAIIGMGFSGLAHAAYAITKQKRAALVAARYQPIAEM